MSNSEDVGGDEVPQDPVDGIADDLDLEFTASDLDTSDSSDFSQIAPEAPEPRRRGSEEDETLSHIFRRTVGGDPRFVAALGALEARLGGRESLQRVFSRARDLIDRHEESVNDLFSVPWAEGQVFALLFTKVAWDHADRKRGTSTRSIVLTTYLDFL